MKRRRRLTLADERALTAQFRAAVEEHGADAIVHHLRDQAGLTGIEPANVARRDQVLAAAAEGLSLLRRRGPSIGLTNHNCVPVAAGLGLVLASLSRCAAASSCEHVGGAAPVPLWALLSPRVVACERCLPRYRGAIVAAARRDVAGDPVCDFCLEEPQESWFVPIALACGPAQLVGHACSSCFVELGGAETRAA
jgi:hypothetical protein